jgi:hypothetical protein
VALGHAVAALRPGAAVALVIAGGAFARFAREGLERAAGSLDLDHAEEERAETVWLVASVGARVLG